MFLYYFLLDLFVKLKFYQIDDLEFSEDDFKICILFRAGDARSSRTENSEVRSCRGPDVLGGRASPASSFPWSLRDVLNPPVTMKDTARRRR